MNTIEYIQHQLFAMRRLTDAALQGMTDEQFNWAPPGTANPISVTLLHAIGGEDMFIHTLLQAKPRVWDSQNWSARIGVSNPPGGGEGWDETRRATLSLAAVMEYQEAVCAETSAYLAALQPEELDRQVKVFSGERPLADVFVLLVNHTTGHVGEIAALKGIQGVKGLPY